MKYIITTPLYYVNDKPHLGSAYTTLVCDALSRYQRLLSKDVLLVTGVDEHGQKIERTSKNRGIPPKEHCDEISKSFITLWNEWGISNNEFIRTSSFQHEKVVREFFERVNNSGDIYMGRQQGWYCVGCEEYKESDNTNNQICPIHQSNLEWRDEENLFFRLSKYQNLIESLVKSETFVLPLIRRNEVINFVNEGLKDFSISRVHLEWGISVPGYQGHTFYVWFDALVGYLTALLKEEGGSNLDDLRSKGWPASLHVIGKDILRFHAVYWPAMLKSAGLDLPKSVFGHGFLTREGRKMGKSIGNVIDPSSLFESFGRDSVRWYLLKDFKLGSDGDIQVQRFKDITNSDLVNTIGNLLNRTSSMSRKWFNNRTPSLNNNKLLSQSEISRFIQEQVKLYMEAMNNLRINKAAEAIVTIATTTNIFINNAEPWKRIKETDKRDLVAHDIYTSLESCRIISILLYPILPDLSERILLQLGISDLPTDLVESTKWGQLKQGSELPEPSPVMNRIEHEIDFNS